jgi:hypothetical protein
MEKEKIRRITNRKRALVPRDREMFNFMEKRPGGDIILGARFFFESTGNLEHFLLPLQNQDEKKGRS